MLDKYKNSSIAHEYYVLSSKEINIMKIEMQTSIAESE